MLIGDPDGFAIWLDYVDSWSTEKFKNGAFGYFLGGNLLWSLRSTLGDDVSSLEAFYCMKNNVEDFELFELAPNYAFRKLYDLTYPEMSCGVDNEWRHAVVPTSLSDEGYCIFLVEFEDKAKLIYGKNNNSENASEIIIRRNEFQRVILSATDEWQKMQAGN